MSVPAHQWSSVQQHMAIEETDVHTDSAALPGMYTIDPSEAERLVEALKIFPIEEVGTSAWLIQHEAMERLNMQAHQSAASNCDEYVLEAIMTFGKVDVLINDLITIEAWKENVYPNLLDHLAGRNTMRAYFILYHEATVVNLFEILLYHKHVCESCGEKMIELADYCARKLTRLNGGYDFRGLEPVSNAAATPDSLKKYAESLETRTPKEELAQYLTEIEFRVCISATALARFVCEHADSLPLSVASRITDTHDFLVLTVPLIENPPWTRRLDNGKWQKLIDQKWSTVQPIDLLKITKCEGQVTTRAIPNLSQFNLKTCHDVTRNKQPWLMLYHLLAKEVFRDRYHLNSFRKGQLLRVRKYLNEMMLDQLPILADMQRYMDELAISEVPMIILR
jgi:zinc finger MYND domain-containing protein 10